MQDERSIITDQYVHICGDCAVEYLDRKYRTEVFEDWLADVRESHEPVMSMELIRTSDITENRPGCAHCWGAHGINSPGTFTIDITTDGDG